MNERSEELVYSVNYITHTRDELIAHLKEAISSKRVEHILGVEKTAVELAAQYGENAEKASIAALLHDFAKERPDEEMRDLIISENMDLELLQFGNNIWHGPTGASLVQTRFGVTDEDILNAIRNHTVGAPEMRLLEKIIYVADYIEPGRHFPGVEEARRLAYTDLDAAVAYATEQTLHHLMEKRAKIYPKAIETYNKWVAEKTKEH